MSPPVQEGPGITWYHVNTHTGANNFYHDFDTEVAGGGGGGGCQLHGVCRWMVCGTLTPDTGQCRHGQASTWPPVGH